jgi:hypothetical protein
VLVVKLLPRDNIDRPVAAKLSSMLLLLLLLLLHVVVVTTAVLLLLLLWGFLEEVLRLLLMNGLVNHVYFVVQIEAAVALVHV